jgi:hypothetical protein
MLYVVSPSVYTQRNGMESRWAGFGKMSLLVFLVLVSCCLSLGGLMGWTGL